MAPVVRSPLLTALALMAITSFACNLGANAPERRGTPIEAGQTIEGRLERSDYTDVFADGSYTDLYAITLTAGQQITVELSSEEVDPYLSIMRGPGDQLVDNDDISPENRNSRVSYRTQAAGRFYIAATTFRPGQTGAYRLVVTAGGGGEQSADGGPSGPSKGGEAGATPR